MSPETEFKVSSHVSRTIFRANDIRGTLGQTLTKDAVFSIGLALGSFLKEKNENQCVVAYDNRESSPLLGRAISQGLIQSGCKVLDIGAVPTPVLYFATRMLDATSGVIITGSHNPLSDNGIKIVLQGKIASEQQLISLFERIQKRQFSYEDGRMESLDIVSHYIDYIQKQIKLNKKIKVVVDCGNAIPGKVVPVLLRKLGCDVIELYCDVQKEFLHHFPDPTEPANLEDLISSVLNTKADIGIAFDSDGDRLGVVTNTGKIIWPDRQLMLFAKDVLQKNQGGTIIYDVKCSMHLAPWIYQYGGKPLMWKTGHSLIEDKIRETNAVLAGEMSGHFFFNDKWFGFDDAIYAAARLLEILSNDPRDSDELFASLPDSVNTPEIRVNIDEDKKLSFIQKIRSVGEFGKGRVTTLDGLRVDFPFGFGLVRASNTTACLVLRFEADTPSHLKMLQKMFKEQLLLVDSSLKLPF